MKCITLSRAPIMSAMLKCCLTLCLLYGTAVQAAGETAASIVFASGKASIVDAKGVQRAAVRGGELMAGDTLDSNDGLVQLRFSDGASMSLQPATRFRVDEYRFRQEDGKASAEDKGFFSLLKGGFRTVTGLIGKQRKEQYRVQTAVAVIGIRGTDYLAKLDDQGLALSTFSGLVEVCNNAACLPVGVGQTVLVSGLNVPPVLQSNPPAGQGGQPGLPGVPQATPSNEQPALPTGGRQLNPPAGTGYGTNYNPNTGPTGGQTVNPLGR